MSRLIKALSGAIRGLVSGWREGSELKRIARNKVRRQEYLELADEYNAQLRNAVAGRLTTPEDEK